MNLVRSAQGHPNARPALPNFDLRPHHFGVSVPDLDAAVNWYETMLGFQLEPRMKLDSIPARIAFLRRDNFRIEIFEVAGAARLPDARREPDLDLRTHGNKHMCFEVANVAAALDALTSRGVDVALRLTVDGYATAFIRDIAGNLIELVEPFRADRRSAV
jgi:methylmalonyl-CoA/ethylmalonyl-CoA epimerase